MSETRDVIRGSNLDALRKRLHEMERLIEQDRRVFEKWKRNKPPGASNFPVPREKKPEKR